jgi:hypothetical protein
MVCWELAGALVEVGQTSLDCLPVLVPWTAVHREPSAMSGWRCVSLSVGVDPEVARRLSVSSSVSLTVSKVQPKIVFRVERLPSPLRSFLSRLVLVALVGRMDRWCGICFVSMIFWHGRGLVESNNVVHVDVGGG